MTVYTIDEIAKASGLSTTALAELGDDELEALAEAVLLEDGDGPDDPDDPDGLLEELNTLSDEELAKLVEVVEEAHEQGVDVPAPLDHLVDDAGSGGATAAAAFAANAGGSGSSDVSLRANTRQVATEHGLPTDWFALDGIDLPPSLADVPMSDKGLAEAINRAHGVTNPGDRVVTAQLVGNVRDKGGADEPMGVSVTDLGSNEDGGGADLDAEQPLPVSTVRNRVESHLSRTGQGTGPVSSGVTLEDLDERSGGD